MTAVLTGPFRQVFDAMPMGAAMVALGRQGQRRILAANPALAEMLAVKVDDLPGRDMKEFSCPEYAEEEIAAVRSLATGERTTYVRQKPYRRADGGVVWTDLRASVLDDPPLLGEEPVPGVVVLAFFIDVTTRMHQERERGLGLATQAAITSIVTRVLAGADEQEIYQLVIDRTGELFAADEVGLLLIDPGTGRVWPVAGRGPAVELMLSGQAEMPSDLTERLIHEGVRVMSEPLLEWARPFVGPAATARFGLHDGGGLLGVGRRPGREPFTQDDGRRLLTLALQVGLAVARGRAGAAGERLAVLEERERIARDLHDTVIQDLIAIGIQLDCGLAAVTDPVQREAQRQRDGLLVEQLEQAILRLRGSVFALHEAPRGLGFGDAVRSVTAEAARILGHRPTVTIGGYLDLVPPAVYQHVLAVLREGLSNVARHAHATATVVHLEVDDRQLRLVVEDDGRGLPVRPPVGNGLANIRQRAAQLDGTAGIARRRTGGTRLTWTCPLHPGT